MGQMRQYTVAAAVVDWNFRVHESPCRINYGAPVLSVYLEQNNGTCVQLQLDNALLVTGECVQCEST